MPCDITDNIIFCKICTTIPGLLVASEQSESLWLISSSLLSKVTASSTREHLPSMNLSKEESASIGVPLSKLVTAATKDGRSSCGNERSDVASNSRCGARSNRPLTKASSSQRAHGSGWRNSWEAACFCPQGERSMSSLIPVSSRSVHQVASVSWYMFAKQGPAPQGIDPRPRHRVEYSVGVPGRNRCAVQKIRLAKNTK